ncbi:MAG: gephyrin-like molybdotransferase Glp [Pseudomonadota bacterium]
MALESINPDPSCEDDYDPNSMPVEQAIARIERALQPVRETESVAIRAALGRVLAAEVTAPFDVPPHRNSARDGYALASASLGESGVVELDIVGTSWAGHPYPDAVAAGQCVRIMTGAAMPDGADVVVMQEHVEVDGALIRCNADAPTAGHVRHPGEDLRAGAAVMAPGKLLQPADLGVLASVGLAEVRVYRRLRVAFFSTGDELRGIGQPLGPGDIYDSNRYTLHGMLTRLGVELIDLGVVADTREAVRDAFTNAAAVADVIVSSGGVSVGDADFVTGLLDELGSVNFWKIAMKPGRPLTFGHVHGAMFFGLPGNPVSVMVTFYQFVKPALRRLSGEATWVANRMRVPLTTPIKKQPGRMEFQRGVLKLDANGQTEVASTGAQGSHILNSMSLANCFIVLPLASTGADAGELVEVEPFEGLV